MLSPGKATLIDQLLLIAVAAVALALAPVVSHADPLQYNILDLGTLGGSYSFGLGINNNGDVVGFSSTDGDVVEHAFRYSIINQMTDLEDPESGTYSYAFGINDLGIVVGTREFTPTGGYHAFLYSDNEFLDLGVSAGFNDLGVPGDLETSSAFGINNNFGPTGTESIGDIVGYASMADGSNPRPFLNSGTSMALIGDGDLNGYAYAYSDVNGGMVAGQFWDNDNDADDGLLDTDGDAIGMTNPLGQQATGYDVNSNGVVVGAVSTTGGSEGFIFDGTSIVSTGTLQGSCSTLWDVNASGQAVGYSYIAQDQGFRATTYAENPTGTGVALQDLNSLINQDDGDSAKWQLWDARAINDSGWITGWGYYHDMIWDEYSQQYWPGDEYQHAYLAIPTDQLESLFFGPPQMSLFSFGSEMSSDFGDSPNYGAVGAFMSGGASPNISYDSYDESGGGTGGTPELPPGSLGLVSMVPMGLIWLRRLRRK